MNKKKGLDIWIEKFLTDFIQGSNFGKENASFLNFTFLFLPIN